MANKRYYWLKLKEDFFRQKEIKKLRRVAGGDTFTIIYLKMLLKSLENDGRLYYDGIEDNFVSELALDIDEDDDNVKMTVAYLLSNGILVQNNQDEFEIITAQEMTGSEGESAIRMRRMRAQKNQASLSDGKASQVGSNVRKCDIEIEIDKDKDIDIDKDKELNCADAQNLNGQKPAKSQNLTPEDHDFWKFAKENAQLAETFYKATGIYPVKSQFGRWVNDLRDLAEAGISAERLQKTIAYMQSENIPLSAPGSCLKTAQWLKSRGGVPVKATRQTQQKPKYNAFELLAMRENGIPVPEYDIEVSA